MARDLAGLVCVRITRDPLGRVRVAILADPERIPHVARRVVGRDVEQAEVVVVRFDIRSVVHFEAHPAEDRVKLAQVLRGHVQMTHAGGRPERDVHRARGQLGLQRRGLQPILPLSKVASSASLTSSAACPCPDAPRVAACPEHRSPWSACRPCGSGSAHARPSNALVSAAAGESASASFCSRIRSRMVLPSWGLGIRD